MLLTIDDVAELCSIDRSTLLGWLVAGDFPMPRFFGGTRVRWSGPELEKWAAAGCPNQGSPGPEFLLEVRRLIHAEDLESNEE